jgi:WhiB family redox-sensing transcriptional regulator
MNPETPVAAVPPEAAAGTNLRSEGDASEAGGRIPGCSGSGEGDGAPGIRTNPFRAPQQEPEPEAWQSWASCSETDPEAFFPEKGRPDTAREAKRVCDGCPVVQECLDFAVKRDLRFGIWGGMTERERRSLHRAARREARTPPLVKVKVEVPVSERMMAARRANVKKAKAAQLAKQAAKRAAKREAS